MPCLGKSFEGAALQDARFFTYLREFDARIFRNRLELIQVQKG
jgi:hypothetical protein